MTATDFDRTASVFTADTLDRVRSENWFSPLTVVRKTWAPSVTVEDAMRGDVPADEVFLSADGHSFETAWHHGPESDESVYVEIRRRHDRSFHGWVDAESRKIVQAG